MKHVANFSWCISYFMSHCNNLVSFEVCKRPELLSVLHNVNLIVKSYILCSYLKQM